jgi:RNA polymerase sigma-70 factor (ECF subfamily)
MKAAATYPVEPDPSDRLMDEACDRATVPIGPLLEGCRQYLMLVATHTLGRELSGKAGASDLVQETFLEAQRNASQFRGRSRQELLAWLCRILACRAANMRRRFLKTQKRAGTRELPLDAIDAGENPQAPAIACKGPSPSEHAIGKELAAILEGALDRLPSHYRSAILWRQQEQLSFQEIGDRLGVTAEAARKHWSRAIVQLRRTLDALE